MTTSHAGGRSWIALCTSLVVAVLAADAGTAPQAPTAMVSGVVMSAETPSAPVRRATVSLVSADLTVPVGTVTDDAGRFVFTGVPAGNYSVVASKPAYVGAFHGSTRPGRGPGIPLVVRDGEHVRDVVLALSRGGAITGRVSLPTGLPADGMTVVVTGVEAGRTGPRPVLRGGRALTDDRGEYRVFGLLPGEYVVQVQPSGLLAGAVGGSTDALQTTASEVSWVEATVRARTTSSIAAGPPMSLPNPAAGRTMQYAKVYYPGTTDPSAAQRVRVELAEERSGVDFSMALVPTAVVSGVVSGPDGAPLAGAEVTLAPADPGLDALAMLATATAVQTGDDGAFSIAAVAPGRYRLVARRAEDASAAPAAVGRGGVRPAVRALADAGMPDVEAGAQLWAEDTISIDGADVTGLSLAARRGMTVSGRVTFEATSLLPPSAEALATGRVSLVPGGPSASIGADGAFAIPGVAPGRYRIVFALPRLRTTPAAPGDGWSLRSLTGAEEDLADRLIDIGSRGDVAGLVATFTDHPPELTGTLTDQAGRPGPGYPIVVFSTNVEDWTAGSRRVAVARPASDGSFRLIGLPAGTYYLCAVVDLDEADLQDPAFLEQLAQAGIAVTLTDGTSTRQDLWLAGGSVL